MERFKIILKSRGKTMSDLAKCFGIDRVSLYSRLKNPKYETLEKLAECLGCDVIELIEPSEKYAHFYHDGEWLGVRKK